MAAVDEDLASGDEAAFIGGEEGDDFRDVLVAPDIRLSASRSSSNVVIGSWPRSKSPWF